MELARDTGSELHVVHVVDLLLRPLYPYSHTRERHETLLELKKLDGLRLLEERVRQVEKLGGVVARSHYAEGRPESQVARLAEELDVGLVVTGGRRRRFYENIFGRGFSDNLLRRSDRPVLVVREGGLRNSAVPKR